MSDRCEIIYHSITPYCMIKKSLEECPKSVLLFGHSMPTARAMSAQAVEPSVSLPFAVCNYATERCLLVDIKNG